MHAKIVTAILIIVLSGSYAAASPKEDAAYITDQLLSDAFLEQARKPLVRAYVDVYADLFLEKSIKVLDRNRLAEILPNSLTDQWVQSIPHRVTENCFKQFPATELSKVATHIRQNPDGTTAPPANFKNSLTQMNMIVALCSGMIVAKLPVEMKKTPLSANDVSHFAEILEINGLFSFPNRIARRSIIAEFRSSRP